MTAALVPDVIPHVIRPMRRDDAGFVWETLLKVTMPKSRGPDGRVSAALRWSDWVKLRGGETEEMLRTARTLVMESGDVLLGFVVAAQGVLHMLYVKRAFRGHGFGLELLRADGPAVDHARHDPRFPQIAPRPLFAASATPSWKRWATLHKIEWVAAAP